MVGEAIAETPTQLTPDRIVEVDPSVYWKRRGHDGRSLEVPTDLDDLICRYKQLTAKNRTAFDRGSFWMDMASRQWKESQSAAFASLVIAIEALGDRCKPPTARFHAYLEQYAPGASMQSRRAKMYALRSDILHGSGLIEMDRAPVFGWWPPEQADRELMEELWGLTKLSMRNWLTTPP